MRIPFQQQDWNALPVVVNTAEDLTQADLSRVMKHSHPVVIKTKKSNERLLDEVKLFLKKIQPRSTQPGNKQEPFSNPIVHSVDIDKLLSLIKVWLHSA